MGFTTTSRKEVVKEIVESFLTGKSEEKIASLTQDDIDASIIPIISGIEEDVMRVITERSTDAFKKRKNSDDTPWWED